jgi:hypothetical protein
MDWAEKYLRKEDHVLPALHRTEERGAHAVYFIVTRQEHGCTFRTRGWSLHVPKKPRLEKNTAFSTEQLLSSTD